MRRKDIGENLRQERKTADDLVRKQVEEDQQLANELGRAREALNKAVRDAVHHGLRVELQIVTRQTMGELEHSEVLAKVAKPLYPRQ